MPYTQTAVIAINIKELGRNQLPMNATSTQLSPNTKISLPDRSVVPWLIGGLMGAWSFGVRLSSLQQSIYPNGWDAYHYLQELQSGSILSADAPLALVYPLLHLIGQLCPEPVLAYQILCASMAALFTMVSFWIGWAFRRPWPTALLLGSWSIFSPHLTYMASQFPKELMGLVLLMAFVGSLQRNRPLWAIAVLVLSLGGHWLGLVGCFFYGLFHQLWGGRRKNWLLVLCALGALGSVVYGYQLLRTGQYDFPFVLIPHFTPYTFLKDFGSNGKINFEWFVEVVDACGLWLLAGYFCTRPQKRNRLLLPLFLFSSLLIFPFWQWDYNGLADQCMLYFALVAPFLFPMMLRVQQLDQSQWPYLATAVFLLGSLFATDAYQAEKHDPNYAQFEQLIQQSESLLQQQGASCVIAHAALADMLSHQTGIKAISWLPSEDIPRDQLWRIAKDIRKSQLENYLSPKELQQTFRLDRRAWLIREDSWQKLLGQSALKKDYYLLEHIQSWRNPQQMR
ncbi:MAG: hypothetical protein AAFV25_13610 [Bacteroidota bacterium]